MPQSLRDAPQSILRALRAPRVLCVTIWFTYRNVLNLFDTPSFGKIDDLL
jgi:hypothetical protein